MVESFSSQAIKKVGGTCELFPREGSSMEKKKPVFTKWCAHESSKQHGAEFTQSIQDNEREIGSPGFLFDYVTNIKFYRKQAFFSLITRGRTVNVRGNSDILAPDKCVENKCHSQKKKKSDLFCFEE